MRRNGIIGIQAVLAIVATVGLASCAGVGAADRRLFESAPPATQSAHPTISGLPWRFLRVADVMAALDCADRRVVAPEPHTRETGRCTIDGEEIRVAVCDSFELCDEWAWAAFDNGETITIGFGFAVAGPSDAATMAGARLSDF